MAHYYVKLGWRYAKRKGGVAIGMTVKAFGPDEAVDLVRERYLDPYPARRFAFSDVREATPDDMALGVANP